MTIVSARRRRLELELLPSQHGTVEVHLPGEMLQLLLLAPEETLLGLAAPGHRQQSPAIEQVSERSLPSQHEVVFVQAKQEDLD